MMFSSIKNRLCKGVSFFVFGILLLGTVYDVNAVEVMAYVDRTNISANDSVNLTVTVKEGEGHVDVSGIKDFTVLSRGTSSNISIVNGVMTKENRSNFTLVPLKKGILSVPKLKVEVGGKIYQTNEIEIQVSGTPQKALEKTSELFITASVSNTSPFTGEQFIYTLKVYHSVRFLNARFQPPEFEGFDSKKIENDRKYSTVVSSKQYNVIELNYVLIPIADGRQTLTPAVLTCDVPQKDKGRPNRFDPFFDDPFFSGTRYVTKTVSSDAIAVDVQSLPPFSADIAFSGLVGKFELDTAIDKSKARVGDSLTVSITLTGSGNIMDAAEPEILVPEIFKVYKDSPEEKIVFNSAGYSGQKTFRLALVPIKEGDATLPAVSYVYFDITQKKYQVLKSQPIGLVISPSTEKTEIQLPDSPVATPPPKFEKKQVEFVGHDILPLKEDLDAVTSRSIMTVYGFFVYLLFPIAGYGIMRLYVVFSQKQMDDKTFMAQKAMQSLKKAAKSELPEEPFLSALYSALISAVFSISGAKGASLTYAEVKDILCVKGFDLELANEAAGLLEKIESAKYSGKHLSASHKTDLLGETKKMVKRIL